MPKITSFSLKNRKSRPAVGALHRNPLSSGGWRLCPQTPTLALSRYEFLGTRSLYIMYDILKPSVFWKIGRRGP